MRVAGSIVCDYISCSCCSISLEFWIIRLIRWFRHGDDSIFDWTVNYYQSFI